MCLPVLLKCFSYSYSYYQRTQQHVAQHYFCQYVYMMLQNGLCNLLNYIGLQSRFWSFRVIIK